MFQTPLHAFERGPRHRPAGAIVPVAERALVTTLPPDLVCATCDHGITSAASRTERSGAHAHAFANPEGQRFEIGCFAAAPGVVLVGYEILAYTWFPGFAWTVALCARCALQLGWRYRSEAGAVFFGLILERLRESGHCRAPGGES